MILKTSLKFYLGLIFLMPQISGAQEMEKLDKSSPSTFQQVDLGHGGYRGETYLNLRKKIFSDSALLGGYGFTSPGPGQPKPTHQFFMAMDYKILRLKVMKSAVNVKTGLGVMYNPAKEYFVKLPKKYPKNYYAPTAFRPWMFFHFGYGTGFGEVFLNTNYLDSEIAPLYHHKGKIPLNHFGSLGIGIGIETSHLNF